MIDDLIGALRHFARKPAQSALTVTILALGLTAGLAVVTYVNGFYQTFPGIDSRGLVRIFAREDASPYLDISYLDYLDYAEATDAFEAIGAVQVGYAASVRHETMTEVAFLEAVADDYFAVLGIEMTIGRPLTATDDRPEAEPVAVLSHSWWQRSFGGDPTILGRTVFLNYRPFTVVGVVAPEFVGATSGLRPDVWIPIAPFRDRYVSWARRAENRDTPLIRVYGRLRAGTSRASAAAALDVIAATLDDAYPRPEQARNLRLDDATWIDPRTRAEEMSTLRVMVAAAAGLILLVCANVANLLSALAAGRRSEFALRAALGASPPRMFRLVLVENLLLAAVAGALALALAGPLSTRLGSYFARPSVWNADAARVMTVDLRVGAAALVLALLTGLLGGVLPALAASSRSLLDALKSGARSAVGGSRSRLPWLPGSQDMLVAAQAALSVVLLVVAGLVLRTLAVTGDIDPGFEHENLVASVISTSSTEIQPEGRELFLRELAERLTEEPWVRSAAIAGHAPLSGHLTNPVGIEGQLEAVPTLTSYVNPGFFDTLGIEFSAGRPFADTDVGGARDVAIVSETLAERYFPQGNPVGQHVWFLQDDGSEGRRFEIVGVTRPLKLTDFLADPEPVLFLSRPQLGYGTTSALMVQTTVPPATAVPRLYRWLRALDPHLAIINALPYTEVVRGHLYTQRMNAEMFSAVAAAGLALAGIGVFSVMSLAVGRRTGEIGVRMALGAHRTDIGRLVLRQAMTPVAIGITFGLLASFALTGLVRSLLTDVEPTDPLTLLTGSAVLLAAALAAAYLPARRATRIDPVDALRA